MAEMEQQQTTIRGVNLGGWLLLERWITPSLFAGTDALDEYTLSQNMTDTTKERIIRHHQTFITKGDFVWLQQQGITALRLPIGTWLWGDEPPYAANDAGSVDGLIAYVDRAFIWAEELGLKILLDIHGAPGSQNGKQESGKIGDITWHKDTANIAWTLHAVERLAKRYGTSPSLLGIELLNEPHRKVPRRALLRYYEAAYHIIRNYCGDTTWVVFSDGFKPGRWKRKLRLPNYQSVYIDTHQYRAYTARDKKAPVNKHIRKVVTSVQKTVAKMQRYHPVVVGEWSLAMHSQSLNGLSGIKLDIARRAYGAAQLHVFDTAEAWFFWTYKTESGGVWSYRDCIKHGWLPTFASQN